MVGKMTLAWMIQDHLVMTDMTGLRFAGDFDSKQAITLLNQSLGKWRPHESQPAEPPAIPTTPLPPQDSPGEPSKPLCYSASPLVWQSVHGCLYRHTG